MVDSHINAASPATGGAAEVTEEPFFRPYVGERYSEGINGKRVLVLGASFYCDRTACPFFRQCTDTTLKSSAPFADLCPEYAPHGKSLRNEPSYCIEDQPRAYQTFAASMEHFFGTADYDNVWSRLAFTNYVQFFLPATDGFRETRGSDLSERDFRAFVRVLQELQPDIVIVWGCVINSRLKEKNEYLLSLQELAESEWYNCHILVPSVGHPIAICNPYHPSSFGIWHINLDTFYHYLEELLDETASNK